MSGRASAAMGVWRARNQRTGRDRAFLGYVVVMVAAIVVAPLVRAVWLSAGRAEVIDAFRSPDAPGAAVIAVSALWAFMLLIGRVRGPALLPPVPVSALATSDLSRVEVFGSAMLRAGGLVTAAGTAVAAVVGGSMLEHGLTDPGGFAAFLAVGALSGLIATGAWLAGQAFPRLAVVAATVLTSLGAASAAVPSLRTFMPWGWVGLAYPGDVSMRPLLLLLVLTVAVLVATPAMVDRIRVEALVVQALRWERAASDTMNLEFGAAATAYQAWPTAGRSVRAIRLGVSGRRRSMFLIRDAIGAVRTPGRVVGSLLALVAGGLMVTAAFAAAAPASMAGAAAGLIVFVGLGPLTDGVRHAASVASDFPIYGISDERLLLGHATFPLVAVVVLLPAAVLVWSVAFGDVSAQPLIAALALGPLSVMVRVSSALKGPLPPQLLVPVPTPAGDLGAAMRFAWALDGVLLAVAGGVAVALMFVAPTLLLVVASVSLGAVAFRWRRRS